MNDTSYGTKVNSFFNPNSRKEAFSEDRASYPLQITIFIYRRSNRAQPTLCLLISPRLDGSRFRGSFTLPVPEKNILLEFLRNLIQLFQIVQNIWGKLHNQFRLGSSV